MLLRRLSAAIGKTRFLWQLQSVEKKANSLFASDCHKCRLVTAVTISTLYKPITSYSILNINRVKKKCEKKETIKNNVRKDILLSYIAVTVEQLNSLSVVVFARITGKAIKFRQVESL